MKMEIAIVAERAGRVTRLCASPGAQVTPGHVLAVIVPD